MELVRLNKMISHNTHYSRREADEPCAFCLDVIYRESKQK